MAGGEEDRDEVAPDEAARAGHEDGRHGGSVASKA
jgi:hypothetical protein